MRANSRSTHMLAFDLRSLIGDEILIIKHQNLAYLAYEEIIMYQSHVRPAAHKRSLRRDTRILLKAENPTASWEHRLLE